eukprot:XP_001704461.1 Hypothetical protein GL50803_26214 [Giardia lamblia ATCC 50803]
MHSTVTPATTEHRFRLQDVTCAVFLCEPAHDGVENKSTVDTATPVSTGSTITASGSDAASTRPTISGSSSP